MDSVNIKKATVRSLIESADSRYFVPMYQREYAWGREVITQLLDDLWDAFCRFSVSGESYYLGSVVVAGRGSQGMSNDWELIDGQQRFTTLTLICRFIEAGGFNRCLFFDNRPKVENFLIAYFADKSTLLREPISFQNAVGCIRDYSCGGDKNIRFEELLKIVKNGKSFKEFILDQVFLFRVEMPGYTDVSSYFEIMNNRGEQLEYHELIKAKLMSKLDGSLHERFNFLWTACSEMNCHLFDRCHELWGIDPEDWQSFDVSECELSICDKSVQSVIPDFPNFLLHVLRSYLFRRKHWDVKNIEETIPLDERKLKEVFDKDEIESVLQADEFLSELLRTRIFFDKYVVKSRMENGSVKQWKLCHINKSDGKYYEKNTFDVDTGEKIVRLQSMLQVTYRTRRYKDWLYRILVLDERDISTPETFLKWLYEYLRKRIKEVVGEGELNEFFRLGLRTPHLILNALDYLMWERDSNNLREFIFAYRNSVEHNHPQHQLANDHVGDEWTNEDIDDIGNLCMMYSRANSSLNNRSAEDKSRCYSADELRTLPPMQQRMYELTNQNQYGWTSAKMRKHSEDLRVLLTDFVNGTKAADNKTDGIA